MIIQRISRILSNFEMIMPLFAGAVLFLVIIAVFSLPLPYYSDQLYPKSINQSSPLNPYDRGGPPFSNIDIVDQYPENSPTAGLITTYLTPLSWFFANTTLYLGTTIVSHPGGIIDEILYNSRGLDTVVEATILFTAFAIAAYLFRRV
jgi:energy-converting hydrogenase A subunit F